MVISLTSGHPTLPHQMMVASVFFLLILVESSLGYFSFFHGATPKLIIAMVFLMAIFNKEDIHLANLVLIGIIFDSLQGAPLGYTSSIMVLVNMIGTIGKRRFSDTPMSYLWLDFAMVMGFVMVYCWACIYVYYQLLPAVGPLIFQYSSTVLLFPVMVLIYQGIQYLVEMVSWLK
jgi:rod shape-determining protein MreD